MDVLPSGGLKVCSVDVVQPSFVIGRRVTYARREGHVDIFTPDASGIHEVFGWSPYFTSFPQRLR